MNTEGAGAKQVLQLSQQQEKGWFGRNWKWFVPVAFIGGLVVIGGFAVGVMWLAMTMIKSSEVYQEAIGRAVADPYVQTALGTPIEEGFLVTGNVKVSDSSGQASLSIPISGPNGKARIYAEASKSRGRWMFSRLTVEVRGTRQIIDLLRQEEEHGKTA
jgi:hypothetical protein